MAVLTRFQHCYLRRARFVACLCLLSGGFITSGQAGVTPAWNEQFSYRIGSVVVYQAARFRAIQISRGNRPDRSPAFWVELGGYAGSTYSPHMSFPSATDRATDGIVSGGSPETVLDKWDTEKQYASAGTIVSHIGRRWVNIAFTQGEEPGVSDVWVAINANTADIDAPWTADKVYDRAGYQVVYKGNRYQNSDWSLGEAPDAFTVWQLIDTTGNVIENIRAWQAGRGYALSNTQVAHEGRIWVNRMATNGEVPGSSAAWKLQQPNLNQPLVWHPLVIFDEKNTQVSWNARVWQNKGWSQGEEPGLSSVWEDISSVATDGVYPWNASKVYDQVGTVVMYQNKTYANQWWTKGEPPGGAGVWKLVRD